MQQGIFNRSIFNNAIFNTTIADQNNWLGGPKDDYWDRVKHAIEEQKELDRLKRIEAQKLEAKKAELAALKEEQRERLETLKEEMINKQLEQYIELAEAYLLELEHQSLALQKRIEFLKIEEDDALVLLFTMPFVN